MSAVSVELPPKLVPIFEGDADVRGAFGGRGSGKTRTFALMTAVRAYIWAKSGKSGIILCGRQYMNSLDESSMEEIKSAIESVPWLLAYFEIGEKYIRTVDGLISYKFAGLDRNISSIKSKAKVLLCWVDEAEPVSEAAWLLLLPTLRDEESELWVTWNPEDETSATHRRFRLSKDPRYKVTEINYQDNPWFPKVLERLRQKDFDERPKSYKHIWDGDFKSGIDGGDFDKEWFILDQTHSLEPLETHSMTKYMVIDPSRTQSATSDYTAMAVIGLNDDGNRYVLEIVRDKLTIDGRYKEMKRLYKKWNVRDVHYKKTAAESEIEAMKLFQINDNYRFPIIPLAEKATEGGKNARIRRLVPDLQALKWFFPRDQRRLMYDGDSRDMMQDFIQQEVLQFPHGEHDDMLDCLSGAYDIVEVWPADTHSSRGIMSAAYKSKGGLKRSF